MLRLAFAAALLLAAGGCKTLDVKSATFNVNVSVNLPLQAQAPRQGPPP